MDYQIVPRTIHHQHLMSVISLLLSSLLPYCFCIVNREIVLTPKQGLQLSGKRIFYEDGFNNENNVFLHRNDTATLPGARPWERTLKHVTYLTLFTNAANGIITGNFSKVKEYNDFLASAYVHSPKAIDSRFGDIITLAEGRLESLLNGSYRFVEGNCDYECGRESNQIALWHVQKIRHRDSSDRKYHYEIKFSISPINAQAPIETIVRGGPNKRTAMEEQRNNMQTFIQKEDDYPNSFREIVTDKDERFLERRFDASRNFRQVNPNYQAQQVTPIPQSTFLRGIYHHPPPLQRNSIQLQHPNLPPQHSLLAHAQLEHNHHHQHHRQQLPTPERLNIGELYKGNYVTKSTSKVELFPNLLNMFMGKPQHSLPAPTTFRPPTYQVKFPRPEIYTLQQHQTQEFPKFSDQHQQLPLRQSQEQFSPRTPAPVPIVAHHYHHHYFMPNNSGITIEQAIQHNGVKNQDTPAAFYNNEVTQVTTPQGYVTKLYEAPHATTTLRHYFPQAQHQMQTQYYSNIEEPILNQNYHLNSNIQQILPPTPQKFVFFKPQIEQQHVVHVTPAPPLRKPYFTQQQQQQQQQQQNYENHPFNSSLDYTTVHVPLLISYPAPMSEETRPDLPTLRNKPFLQSDPIQDTVHYSEPDPLYANVNDEESRAENKLIPQENQEPQLEAPHQNQQNSVEVDNRREHSESIEAQLLPPNPNTDGPEEDKISEDIREENSTHISNEVTTKAIKTEASNSVTTATKRPQIIALRNKRIIVKPATTSTTTLKPLATETTKYTNSKARKTFVFTSSTESPSRTISRYRNSYARTSSTSTTSTEKPVLKWTPKRKNNNAKFTAVKSTTPIYENDAKDENVDDSSNENEDFKTNESNNIRNTNATPAVIILPTTTEMSNTITDNISNALSTLSPSPTEQPTSQLLAQKSQTEIEIYEVLTQKSVSKSVSLKVGNNGEEIPVIIDDEENEVKTV